MLWDTMVICVLLSHFYIHKNKTKKKCKSSFGVSFGDVLMLSFWEAMMWNHLRGSWDNHALHLPFSGLLTSSYCTCTLEKINSKAKWSSTQPCKLTSVPTSVLSHVPRNGTVTVCPQRLSSLGPKNSWAKINYPDLAFFNPWDSDPDMFLSREKRSDKHFPPFRLSVTCI